MFPVVVRVGGLGCGVCWLWPSITCLCLLVRVGKMFVFVSKGG